MPVDGLTADNGAARQLGPIARTLHTLIARAQVQRTRGVCAKRGVEFDDDRVFHTCPCLGSYRGGIAGAKTPARRSAAVRTRVETGEYGRIRPAQVLTARPACTLSVPGKPGSTFLSRAARAYIRDREITCYLYAKRLLQRQHASQWWACRRRGLERDVQGQKQSRVSGMNGQRTRSRALEAEPRRSRPKSMGSGASAHGLTWRISALQGLTCGIVSVAVSVISAIPEGERDF